MPFFSVVCFSRETLPQKRVNENYWGDLVMIPKQWHRTNSHSISPQQLSSLRVLSIETIATLEVPPPKEMERNPDQKNTKSISGASRPRSLSQLVVELRRSSAGGVVARPVRAVFRAVVLLEGEVHQAPRQLEPRRKHRTADAQVHPNVLTGVGHKGTSRFSLG